MVLLLLAITRRLFKLENLITKVHFDAMNKIILFCSIVIGFAYCIEFFTTWYSGNQYEIYTFKHRATGTYNWSFILMVFCNVIAPQVLWFKKYRRNITV